MIFHNPYTITIELTSLYFETLDPGYLCVYRAFALMSRKGEAKFIEQFNDLFGGKELDSLSSDRQMQMILFNRANNLLPALHEGLRVGLLTKDQKAVRKSLKFLFETYEDEFGKKFKSLEDLEPIKKEIDRLRRKLRGWNVNQAPREKFDFEEVVINTELILNTKIERSIKLFQFKRYFDKAAKIAMKDGRN